MDSRRAIDERELLSYRQFGSRLEGHPTSRFPYGEAATGSLGQGLGIGLGMALNATRLDRLPYRTYVLLGDSEMSEGSQGETIQLAAHYQLANLVGIIDVNRLGQRGRTMLGHDIEAYARRVAAFGWKTITIDGHDMSQILDAYRTAQTERVQPVMIIARTLKGKGISFLEDADGWHGKALEEDQQKQALSELAGVDREVRGTIATPDDRRPERVTPLPIPAPHYEPGKSVATRKAYGTALTRIARRFPDVVSLDGEVSNSTMAEMFAKELPERFFEMFIAEQNMVEVALGLSLRGKIPFVSTFAAFLTRAFDQIRMSQYHRQTSSSSVHMPACPLARTGRLRWASKIWRCSAPSSRRSSSIRATRFRRKNSSRSPRLTKGWYICEHCGRARRSFT